MTLVCVECGVTSEDGEGWKAELALPDEYESTGRGRTRLSSSARSAGRVSSATRVTAKDV
jgi:hypothetical protein